MVDMQETAPRWVEYLLMFFPFMAQQLLLGQELPIIEASRSHSIRHTTIGTTPLDE
jgi:hypothetical protein